MCIYVHKCVVMEFVNTKWLTKEKDINATELNFIHSGLPTHFRTKCIGCWSLEMDVELA